ncbi:MAG: double-strand break repair protein AddB [Rhodobacteraceae bacterium]|nr:double-strand break repair protein AddB [Paracoccaceae bacterium]
MFEPRHKPRLFGLPPGADFARALTEGLLSRMDGTPPEALARVEIHVNTLRMKTRLTECLTAEGARLLPNIRVLAELGRDTPLKGLPPAVPPLRRRLEIAGLIAALLDREPTLAPRAALFDLADSLARLLAEMQEEGVTPDAIAALDVTDLSGHWERSQQFLGIVSGYFSGEAGIDPEARQRRVVEAIARRWAEAPPDHPVLVAGSTGSRGATALFMEAVARLPQGAVILPGYDFDQPARVWDRLDDALTAEDHPQYRFRKLMEQMSLDPDDIRPWTEAAAPVPERNRLISLALRPAPVTDQWQAEGPDLTGLDTATAGLTLIEAPSPRNEAVAIALILRRAVEAGRKAALITPDRTLTRQVGAALERWGITPDDSAGRPLHLTAPGRLLLHIAEMAGRPLDGADLLTLLKHPLVNTGGTDRGPHLLWSRELELELRRNGPAFPDGDALAAWASKHEDGRDGWAAWVGGIVTHISAIGSAPLEDLVSTHLAIAEALAAGPTAGGSGELWQKEPGQKARAAIDELLREAPNGGEMSVADYANLLKTQLQAREVREVVEAHPLVLIRGTLEARVPETDLVILGGLNEGVWPSLPAPDPWLNRRMRKNAGLRVPERQIGLSAHDFQQAAAAPDVVLSRAVRDAEAETVPSRWINRVVNLLSGLESGEPALEAMRSRGEGWVDLATELDRPRITLPRAPRPSPAPPVAARPSQLSITRIQTLIRDPYAIYAGEVLRLKRLDPLTRSPDAPLRGIVVHEVLEKFLDAGIAPDGADAKDRLLEMADEVLATHAPWAAARLMWRAKLERVADWFLSGEVTRQAEASPLEQESYGKLLLPEIGFTLSGKVDRIDKTADETLHIYDYKTGSPPTKKVQEHFDKQLFLSALMAEEGVLEGVPAAPVTRVAYIGLGSNPKVEPTVVGPEEIGEARAGLVRLIAAYQDRAKGFTARRAMQMSRYDGDFDHLARRGEWDDTEEPRVTEIGP